jgi:hypothetical protein
MAVPSGGRNGSAREGSLPSLAMTMYGLHCCPVQRAESLAVCVGASALAGATRPGLSGPRGLAVARRRHHFLLFLKERFLTVETRRARSSFPIWRQDFYPTVSFVHDSLSETFVLLCVLRASVVFQWPPERSSPRSGEALHLHGRELFRWQFRFDRRTLPLRGGRVRLDARRSFYGVGHGQNPTPRRQRWTCKSGGRR